MVTDLSSPLGRGRRLLAIGALIVVAAALYGLTRDRSPEQAARRSDVERISLGSGVTGVDVLRRRGAAEQRAVIFLHGWRLLGRAAYHAWQLRLARRGLTVIVPRYQQRVGTPPEDTLANAITGVRDALARFPVRAGGVLVIGHSAGAALAADYAAVATRERLPRARAVLAIYPGRMIRASSPPIPEVDLSRIPPQVRLTVMMSRSDAIVGEAPARELYDAATRIPTSRRRLVEVVDPAAGDHFAPALDTRAARRVFWSEFDELLRTVR